MYMYLLTFEDTDDELYLDGFKCKWRRRHIVGLIEVCTVGVYNTLFFKICAKKEKNRMYLKTEENENVPTILDNDVKKNIRGNWGNQIEFILTLIGFAVGLGNVWRFPYLCYRNGGGAFLIPYFTCLFVMGIPLFYLELCFGQFSSLGPLKIWVINPAFKGLGISMLLINSFIVIYYNVVVAYCIFYFFASMTATLPWSNCDNDWNTCDCRTAVSTDNTSVQINSTRPECANYTLNPNKTTTPSEEFFFHRVLKRSSGLDESGPIVWELALCLLLGWIIIYLVLARGIKSLGKVMYFAAIFPYVILTVLLVRGLTLDGYKDGVEFYLRPNITKLAEGDTWSDAATQIFYSLGTCLGGLIAMASFNNFRNNVLRDTFLIPLINCGTSFYAGFVIFSVLGFMAKKKGVLVSDVVDNGPGLTFIVYPEALAQMPVSTLWAILFFFMMVMLGFSSQFSATETVISAIMDELPALRKTKLRGLAFRGVICSLFFLLGLPMTTQGGYFLFNVIDNYAGGFPLLFCGFFELVAVIYLYGFWKFRKDIEMMLGRTLPTKISFFYFAPLWCFFSPVCLLTVIVFKAVQYKPLKLNGYDYPDFGDAIGWLTAGFPILLVPVYILAYYCVKGGASVWMKVISPSRKWGPALEEHRSSRYPPLDPKPSAAENGAVVSTILHEQANGNPITPFDNVAFEQEEKM